MSGYTRKRLPLSPGYFLCPGLFLLDVACDDVVIVVVDDGFRTLNTSFFFGLVVFWQLFSIAASGLPKPASLFVCLPHFSHIKFLIRFPSEQTNPFGAFLSLHTSCPWSFVSVHPYCPGFFFCSWVLCCSFLVCSSFLSRRLRISSSFTLISLLLLSSFSFETSLFDFSCDFLCSQNKAVSSLAISAKVTKTPWPKYWWSIAPGLVQTLP